MLEKVEFPMYNLSLDEYLDDESPDKGRNYLYDLVAVGVWLYKGLNHPFNHYFSTVFNHQRGIWQTIDDNIVTDNKSEFKKWYKPNELPRLLIYKRTIVY